MMGEPWLTAKPKDCTNDTRGRLHSLVRCCTSRPLSLPSRHVYIPRNFMNIWHGRNPVQHARYEQRFDNWHTEKVVVLASSGKEFEISRDLQRQISSQTGPGNANVRFTDPLAVEMLEEQVLLNGQDHHVLSPLPFEAGRTCSDSLVSRSRSLQHMCGVYRAWPSYT